MERRRNGIDRQPQRRHRDQPPSFSSTLLDAIYRSIDETDGRGAPDSAKKQSALFCFPESRKSAAPPRRAATSSSSDASSYGGFSSSSDAESASTPHLRPIRTGPQARSARLGPDDGGPNQPGADENRAKKERRGSIRSCLRDLRSGRSPASPGARIASFIGSLFFAAKSKVSAELASSAEELSCSRSCLSKTPSAGKRRVRFCPVSVVVGEDRRPCGEKWVCSGGGPAAAAAAARRMEEEEEEEEDLFELKSLAVIGRFRDELPVYETTRVGKYGGRGFVL